MSRAARLVGKTCQFSAAKVFTQSWVVRGCNVDDGVQLLGDLAVDLFFGPQVNQAVVFTLQQQIGQAEFGEVCSK